MVLQEKDVEQVLWKCVFYKPIEEFRRRFAQASRDDKNQKDGLIKVCLPSCFSYENIERCQAFGNLHGRCIVRS